MKLSMGIIKIEIKVPELVKAVESFKENRQKAFEEISCEVRRSVSSIFNQILQAEFELFLGQSDPSLTKKNGFTERDFSIKGIGSIRVKVPRDRSRKFESSIVPKNIQIDNELKKDLAVLHLAGISNRTLALISKRVLGVKVSPQTVHNSLSLVEDKALAWLDRPIDKKYWALFVDGTNFKIQRRGSTEKEPTLVVLGIDDRNCLSILTLQPGQKDDAGCWRGVFKDLANRGLKTDFVQIGVMDGLSGLEVAFKEAFKNSVTSRCWVHAKVNIMNKCPARLSDAFEGLLAQVMYADSESEARKAFYSLKTQMGPDAESSIRCLEKDIESLLSHYKFPKQFWRTLKTTNPIERVNKELKRRTKTMEGLGENTLNILLAFTAMRLEYHWQRIPVDSPSLKGLNNIYFPKNEENIISDVLENLIH
jgi:putative transposase